MATTSRRAPAHPDPAVQPSPPDWLPQTESALQELLELPANWDSYGARPIRAEVVAEAVDLLHKIVQPGTPQPAVVPTARGGLQLEWHIGGIDLEIEFEQPGRFHVSYEEPIEDVELEADLTLTDHPRLTELIARLSPRQ